MRGLPLGVYLSVLIVFSLKLRHATPTSTVTDLQFFHWCIEKNGEFIAHPLECSKFIRCSHNRAYIFECPTKLRWNQTMKTCDWEDRTKCFLNDAGTEINVAAIGGDKKKSVKRDTSLHTEIYEGFQESNSDSLKLSKLFVLNATNETLNDRKRNTEVVERTNVTEYPKPTKTNNIVSLISLKSIFKTPCIKNVQQVNVTGNDTAANTVNNITEHVEPTKHTPSNNFDYKTSTELVNSKDVILMKTTNSNEALTELTTVGININLITTGLPDPDTKNRTYKADEELTESLYSHSHLGDTQTTTEALTVADEFLTESSFNHSQQDNTPATETLTEVDESNRTNLTESFFKDSNQYDTPITATLTVLMTHQPSETMLNSELPDVSKNIYSEVSKQVSSNPISVLTEIFTDTTAETQNDNEIEFSDLSNQNFYQNPSTTKSKIFHDVTDIYVELTGHGNTEFVLTSVATEIPTEISIETTDTATVNSNIILTADSVNITEHNVTDNNEELTVDGNTKFTTEITEADTETSLQTTETTTGNSNIISVDSVNITDHIMELIEDRYTEFKFTSEVAETKTEILMETIETATVKGNMILTADYVNITEHNVTDNNEELIVDDNTKFTTEVTEADTETSLKTTPGNSNIISVDSVDITEHNTELTDDRKTEFKFTSVVVETQTEISRETKEATTGNGTKMLADSVDITVHSGTVSNKALTEYDTTTVTSVVTDAETETSLQTTEITTSDNIILADSVDITEHNTELTDDGNTELKFTSVVAETQTEISRETTEAIAGNGTKMLADSVDITVHSGTVSNKALTEYDTTTVTSVVTEAETEIAIETTEATTEHYMEVTEERNTEYIFTSIKFTTDKGNTVTADSVDITEHNVADINVESTDADSTEFIFTSVVTATQTENSLTSTESPTDKGYTVLADTVDVTEQNIKDMYFDLTEGDNTESILTSVVTETESEIVQQTIESMTDNYRTLLADSVDITEENVKGQNLETTEDGNHKFIFTAIVTETQTEFPQETTESVTDKIYTILVDSVKLTEQNKKDLNLKLTEVDNNEIIFTASVTKSQNEQYLETTEIDNSIFADSVGITEHNSYLTELATSVTKISINTDDSSDIVKGFNNNDMEALTTVRLRDLKPITVLTEDLAELFTDTPDDLTETTTNLTLVKELPTNFTITNKNPDDSLEIPREITSKVESLTTERLTDSKPIIMSTMGLTELLTHTPDDLTESITNLVTETEKTSTSAENLKETSTITDTANTIYSVKLTDEILSENVVQVTKNFEFLTETSREDAVEISKSSTNVITTNSELFTDSTTMTNERSADENVITTLTDSLHNEYTTLNSVKLTEVTTPENMAKSNNEGETKIMEFITDIWQDFKNELREDPSNVITTNNVYVTEPITYPTMVTEPVAEENVITTLQDNDVTAIIETQNNFTETVQNSKTLTEVTNVNETIENVIAQNILTEFQVILTTTKTDGIYDATKEHDSKDSSITKSNTDEPVTPTVGMLDFNSDTNIMLTSNTVVPSTVLTYSVIITEILFEERVNNSQAQKHNELNSSLVQDQEPRPEIIATTNVEPVPLMKNKLSTDEIVNVNLTTTTALVASTTAEHLSNEFLASSTTIDPRLPFRSPECRGENNNRQFKASKCSQYYQCFAGWAFLLNCYEGYQFVTQEAKCIEDMNRECNE